MQIIAAEPLKLTIPLQVQREENTSGRGATIVWHAVRLLSRLSGCCPAVQKRD